jgi:ABC-type proline/glycine betaine transport system substrate-binding protein
VSLQGKNIDSVKKNTEISKYVLKEVGLEVKAVKAK